MIGEEEVLTNIKRKSTIVCESSTGEVYVLKKQVIYLFYSLILKNFLYLLSFFLGLPTKILAGLYNL